MKLGPLWLLSVLFAALAGCSDVECDPGQINNGEFCKTPPAMPDPMAEGGAPSNEPATGFGMTCSDTSECPSPTDWCAIQPSATSGSCTRKGCLEDTTICPADWGCMDLSVFSPALPSICTPP